MLTLTRCVVVVVVVTSYTALVFNEHSVNYADGNYFTNVTVEHGDGAMMWCSHISSQQLNIYDNTFTDVAAPNGAGGILFSLYDAKSHSQQRPEVEFDPDAE